MSAFPTNVDDDVLLELPRVESTTAGLDLTYTVSNGAQSAIYLANVLYHWRATGFEVDPNVVYTEVIDDGILHISKQLIKVPDNIVVETPEVPYLTRVEAGEEYLEDLHLAFPIQSVHPYRSSHAEEPEHLDRFTFSLGYAFDDEALRVKEVTVSDGSIRYRASYTRLVTRQRLKVFGPIQTRLSVAMARDG
jgi:hypothetical protein